jgi:hypothetical protein
MEVSSMVHRKSLLAVVVLAVSLALFAYFDRTTRAQEGRPAAFEHVAVVTYANGLTGFFDRDTGTLFVYDQAWNKCVIVRRINQLGSPMVNLDRARR